MAEGKYPGSQPSDHIDQGHAFRCRFPDPRIFALHGGPGCKLLFTKVDTCFKGSCAITEEVKIDEIDSVTSAFVESIDSSDLNTRVELFKPRASSTSISVPTPSVLEPILTSLLEFAKRPPQHGFHNVPGPHRAQW
jgi:hypothetical protein